MTSSLNLGKDFVSLDRNLNQIKLDQIPKAQVVWKKNHSLNPVILSVKQLEAPLTQITCFLSCF